MLGLAASLLLSDAARAAIAAAIRAADGSEVFFFGKAAPGDGPGTPLKVVEVEDFCRGNDHMVPVLRRAARGFDVAIHNHPSGDLTPSDPDLLVAAELGDLGLGFFIVDNAAARVNPVVKLLPREAPPPPVDLDEIARALGPDGPLAQRLGAGFEARDEQVRMASAVASALARSGVALIEAGTGTGKSLAYLVPALLRAVRARERVVVSTNTINLQEQLVKKDIPLVLQAWGGIVGNPKAELPRAVLMKGRSNYACLRKVEDLGTTPEELFEDDGERDEVRTLAAWAARTKEGSKEELTAPPSPGAWEKVAVDADTCTRTACKFYQECFYFKARREAGAADLIVVNHHLLLSDLAVRRSTGFKGGAVLPPYRHVIIDEAHHLEDVASDHFGEQVTSPGLRRTLGRLLSARRHERGLLPALRAKLLRLGGDEAGRAARGIDERAIPARQDIDWKLDGMVDAAGAFLSAVGARVEDDTVVIGADGRPPPEPGLTLRVKPEHRGRPEWRQLVAAGAELASALGVLVASIVSGVLRPLEVKASEDSDEDDDGGPPAGLPPDVAALALEAKAVAGRIEAAAAAISAFLAPEPKAGTVPWVERRRSRGGREPTIAMVTAPLEVAEALATEVYPNLGGIVLTSATMAVGDGVGAPAVARDGAGVSGPFHYVASRIGLDRLEPGRLETLRLASPFDYAKQCVLCVPTDIADPAERGFDAAAADALLGAAKASGGRAFFLFTSYRALDRAWRTLERPLRALGLTTLRQGEASRGRLIERFRSEAPAVLFATDSFWEGVDVRGGALRLVAIGRLPFKVPSEPLQEARAEAIAARGGDAFHELTVPQAVLKLKQGFGRLVRSRADRGAILILDRRVLTKRYGRLFLESLPPARLVRGPMPQVLAAIGDACRAPVPQG